MSKDFGYIKTPYGKLTLTDEAYTESAWGFWDMTEDEEKESRTKRIEEVKNSRIPFDFFKLTTVINDFHGEDNCLRIDENGKCINNAKGRIRDVYYKHNNLYLPAWGAYRFYFAEYESNDGKIKYSFPTTSGDSGVYESILAGLPKELQEDEKFNLLLEHLNFCFYDAGASGEYTLVHGIRKRPITAIFVEPYKSLDFSGYECYYEDDSNKYLYY